MAAWHTSQTLVTQKSQFFFLTMLWGGRDSSADLVGTAGTDGSFYLLDLSSWASSWHDGLRAAA